MKKFIYSIMVLIIASLVVVPAITHEKRGHVLDLVLPRNASATTTVYDTKALPGSDCRVANCNWTPTTVADLQDITTTGFVPYTPFIFVKNDPYTDVCYVMCPILKDNSSDSVGVRSASIDMLVQPLGNPPMSSNSSRAASCHLVETTALWTDSTGRQQLSEGDGASVSTPFASTNTHNSIFRLTLPIPYPNVPQDAWSHGATYAGGTAAIICTVPVNTFIYGYSWQELGANSSDW